ncbi:hypothetical protein ACQR5S_19975 [Xanthomonas oryzae pv. oryzicola]|uniref:hypothetical protein n=1 Tax=Xanthomonas oryzae TaxID=347 RepID=UPI001033744E|nr:hypothetical protein [Xanthomonas oryzae]QBG94636.1 hypothetical protein EYC55_02870 [Xanthomonas oryzae]QBH01321.1 hypothetical protein EYC56_21215 [Xanthomonas oryzae]
MPSEPPSSPSPLEHTLGACLSTPRSGIPLPALFRATGALTCWRDWYKHSIAQDQHITLSHHSITPLICSHQIREAFDEQLRSDPDATATAPQLDEISSFIGTNLAFSERKGAIIESTPTLVEWLAHTDMARELPARLLRPSFPALYFHTLPISNPELAQKIEGVFLFEHQDPIKPVRAITFAVVEYGKTHLLPLDAMSVTIIDEETPLIEWVSQHIPEKWTAVLEAVVKVMLYMGLRDARIQPRNEYSEANRNFPGLGKRKRDMRLQQVERLYDRITVGPDKLPTHLSSLKGSHHVSPHWRRGHFRQQVHGPHNSERKLIFVAPVLVHAEQLANDAPTTKSYVTFH